MATKKNRWYENTWVITIVGGVITTTVGTLVYDSIKNKPVLSTMWGLVVKIGYWLLSLLNYQLKVWWLLAGITCLILLLFAIAFLQKDSDGKAAEPNKPPFTDYVEDKFTKWLWRWNWKLGSDGWDVVNLTPYCQTCDTPMQNYGDFFQANVMCPRCKVQSYPSYSEGTEETKTLILDNVRKRYK